MPRAISNDLRKRIIDCVKEGVSAREAGRRFKVSPSFAVKLVKRFNETGSYFSNKVGGYKPFILSPIEKDIINLIENHPDWTLFMYVENIKENHNMKIHYTTLSRFLNRLGYSYKKNGICNRTRQT